MGGIRLEADISAENGNVNRQVNRRSARNAARQAASNLNPNEESLARRVENNRRRNERNRLRRDETNNRQNARNAARYEKMHCIARSNTIPDYNYLGEMNYICQQMNYICGAKSSRKMGFLGHFLIFIQNRYKNEYK